MPPYSKKAKFIHEEVEPKENFDPRSFRVKPIGKHGRKATYGCPKGEWSPSKERCKVGMRMQKIMTPRKGKK